MWISRKRWNEVCFELNVQKKEIAKISRLLGITDYNGQESDKKGIWYPGKKQNDLYFKAYAQHGAVINISKRLGIIQNTGDENVKKTIDAICNHIRKALESEPTSENLSEEIKALAELVSDRATEPEQLFEVDGEKIARIMSEAIRGKAGDAQE